MKYEASQPAGRQEGRLAGRQGGRIELLVGINDWQYRLVYWLLYVMGIPNTLNKYAERKIFSNHRGAYNQNRFIIVFK